MEVSEARLQVLLAQAAEDGARRALERVGLHDEDAAGDVRELRGLLDAWRDARRTAWQGIIKGITTAALALMVAGLAVYWRR